MYTRWPDQRYLQAIVFGLMSSLGSIVRFWPFEFEL